MKMQEGYFDVQCQDMTPSSLDNTARVIAMKLCQEMGSMKLSEIGDLFGIGSDSGVTKAIGRLKERMTEDGSLTDVFNVLCQDLLCFQL